MKILIATHGNLAEGLLESYNMIAGEGNKQTIHTVKLTESGIGEFRERLHSTLDELTENEKVLVLCDLKGGTPYNESFMYSLEKPGKIEVITGVNLPMLIEVGFLAETATDLTELANVAVGTGLESIEKLEDSNDQDDDLGL